MASWLAFARGWLTDYANAKKGRYYSGHHTRRCLLFCGSSVTGVDPFHLRGAWVD
jgi:hypothetical protein